MPEKFLHIEKGDKVTKEMLFAYLQGKMQEGERMHFEKLLSEDPFLQDAVEGLRGADMQVVNKTLDSILHDVDVITGLKKQFTISASFKKYAVAAMILAFVGLTWLITSKLNSLQDQQQVAMEDKQRSEEMQIAHPDTGMGGGNMLSDEQEVSATGTVGTTRQNENKGGDGSGNFAIKPVPEVIRGEQMEEAELSSDALLAEQEDMPLVADDEFITSDTFSGASVQTATVEVSRMFETNSAADVQLSSVTIKDNKKKSDRDTKDIDAEKSTETLANAPSSAEETKLNTRSAFAGGDDDLNEYFEKNIRYPSGVSVKGEVIVGFTVQTDGSIFDPHIIQQLEPSLDAEVLRLVQNMPAWTPAYKQGVAVESEAELSIRFKDNK